MSKFEQLKSAKDLSDLAKLLGFTPKGLSYVLYKLDPSVKYRSFDIPKKKGGIRTIHAPEKRLSLLQRRLGEMLYQCVAEIQHNHPKYWHASHGFQKKKTIVSNSKNHCRRRYVFNVDLEDFFGTINFGRVRGFFINDNSFKLVPSIATLIAQIACHNNALPQGSPCSPVIANLVGNILDARLLALARDSRCTYTRYADDLTFSTNTAQFPNEIAVNTHDGEWKVGDKLLAEIERTGFKLNSVKTRMSYRRSRQTVTGLVVNTKPNISQDYYRSVRAMCNSVFQAGEYHRGGAESAETMNNLRPLEGMLSHIYFVKARRDRSSKTNKAAIMAGEFRQPQAAIELYRRFLFYRHFVAMECLQIVTEGISDITYLHCAIRALAKSFPSLANEKDGKIILSVSFLKPSSTIRTVLNLGNGTAGQASLIDQYKSNLKKYAHKPMDYPVIILCDNDDGAKSIFKNAIKAGAVISEKTIDPFYHLGDNLYLVKVPEGTPPQARAIEELFPPSLLAETVDGKPFDPKKEHGDESAYGKVIFAEKIVRAKAGSIDFSGFSELLSRIDQCLSHYKTVKPAASMEAANSTEAAASQASNGITVSAV